MAEIKLIAIDLDGTLLSRNKTISMANKAAVRAASAAGIPVVLATARQYLSASIYALQLGLETPFICANGAQAFASAAGPKWWERTVPMPVARRVCEVADEHGWELSTLIGQTTYFRQRPGQALGTLMPGVEVVARNSDALLQEPVRMFTWIPEAATTLTALCAQEFPEICDTVTLYEPDGSLDCMGMFAPDANKGAALQFVLDKVDIAPENVMAIGDNNNDLSMLSLAGLSVAMGNGTPQAKAHADVIAPSNDEAGVAWAIEHFALG